MYKLELSTEELQVIFAGLGELPAKTSIPVINKLNQEIITQNKEQAEQATE